MATVAEPTRFDVVLSRVKAFEDDSAPRIVCTASSDEVDLGVDRFMLSALMQMRDSFPGMAIYLNHKYVLPEDLFGHVTNATIVERDGHHDLDLEISLDTSNDRAMRVYKQIQQGIKLGVSVGVLVNDAEVTTETVDGKKLKVLNIRSVTTLEASIVGIPANRRSWVQGALKAASYYFDGEQRELLEKLAASVDSGGGMEMAIEDEIVTNDTETLESESEIAQEAQSGEESVGDPEGAAATTDDAVDNATDVSVDAPAAATEPVEAASDEAAVEETVAESEPVLIDYSDQPNNQRQWYSIKAVGDGEGEASDTTEILIYDQIGYDWWTGGGVVAQKFVEDLNNVTSKNIDLRINSPGGVITEAITIKNALDRHPATVTAYVDGMAASSASFIALGSDKLYMSPDAMMMIHEPWSGMWGNAAAFEKEAEVLNKFADTIASMYARKAGGTVEEWRARMVEETWMTDKEAVDLGLADGISDNSGDLKEKTFNPAILARFKNAPEAAKTFFVAAAPEAVTADAGSLIEMTNGITNLASALRLAQVENETLRTSVKGYEDATILSDRAWVDANALIKELTTKIEVVLDLPLPRKIVPEGTFDNLAEKYPWLDSRILAQLARISETDK